MHCSLTRKILKIFLFILTQFRIMCSSEKKTCWCFCVHLWCRLLMQLRCRTTKHSRQRCKGEKNGVWVKLIGLKLQEPQIVVKVCSFWVENYPLKMQQQQKKYNSKCSGRGCPRSHVTGNKSCEMWQRKLVYWVTTVLKKGPTLIKLNGCKRVTLKYNISKRSIKNEHGAYCWPINNYISN